MSNRIRPLDAGVAEDLTNQGQQAAQMVARSDLRHHAAIDRVQVNLAVQVMRKQAILGAVDSNPGLVTTGFNTQYVHRRE